MTSWWRSWHNAPTDNKWIVVAARAGVRPGVVSAIYWALCDYASQHDERGSISGFDIETYSAFSGFSEAEVSAVIQSLTEKKLIRDDRLTAWEKRQPVREDDSASRQRDYRQRRVSLGLPSGAAYKKFRAALIERDGERCVYCGKEDRLLTDHMTPVSQGGTDDIDNLALACKPCVSGKSGKTPEQAGYTVTTTAFEALTRYRHGVSRSVTTDKIDRTDKIEREKNVTHRNGISNTKGLDIEDWRKRQHGSTPDQINQSAKANGIGVFVIKDSLPWAAWHEYRQRVHGYRTMPVVEGQYKGAAALGWYFPTLYPPGAKR